MTSEGKGGNEILYRGEGDVPPASEFVKDGGGDEDAYLSWRLEDHGVSGDKSRSQLRDSKVDGVVEWRNSEDNP